MQETTQHIKLQGTRIIKHNDDLCLKKSFNRRIMSLSKNQGQKKSEDFIDNDESVKTKTLFDIKFKK